MFLHLTLMRGSLALLQWSLCPPRPTRTPSPVCGPGGGILRHPPLLPCVLPRSPRACSAEALLSTSSAPDGFLAGLLASRTSALPDGFGSCLCLSRLRQMGVSLSAAWCRGVLPQMATDKAISVESAAAPAPAPSPGSCFASITDALVQHHALGHPCQAWTSRSETDVAPAPAPYSPMPSCVPNQNTLSLR